MFVAVIMAGVDVCDASTRAGSDVKRVCSCVDMIKTIDKMTKAAICCYPYIITTNLHKHTDTRVLVHWCHIDLIVNTESWLLVLLLWQHFGLSIF